MKKHIRKPVLLLSMLLAVAGCTQAPKEVNGHPVEVVGSQPLLRPLEINTDKEQHLYFRFKKQPAPDDPYIISAVAILPGEYETRDFFLNDILIKEKRMSFELELTHYDKNGKATPVGLIQPIELPEEPSMDKITPNPAVFGKNRFDGIHINSFSYGLEKGYYGRVNGLAYIDRIQEGGYYHLTIRSLDNYRDYPKMKLAVEISYVVHK